MTRVGFWNFHPIRRVSDFCMIYIYNLVYAHIIYIYILYYIIHFIHVYSTAARSLIIKRHIRQAQFSTTLNADDARRALRSHPQKPPSSFIPQHHAADLGGTFFVHSVRTYARYITIVILLLRRSNYVLSYCRGQEYIHIKCKNAYNDWTTCPPARIVYIYTNAHISVMYVMTSSKTIKTVHIVCTVVDEPFQNSKWPLKTSVL